MRITVLGSGTSKPDGRRNSSGYFVEAGGVRILMDCGAGSLHALARYEVPWEDLTHVLISHYHVDHVGELASLFQALKHGASKPRSAPLALIGPTGLNRVIEGLKQAFGEKLFILEFPLDVSIAAPGEALTLDNNTLLRVAKTPHTDESVAYRIESGGRVLCYTGDTSWSDDLLEFFQKADLLISECSFEKSQERGKHLSIVEAARMAARAGVKRLVVTHFYFEVDEASLAVELRKEFSGDIAVAEDGLVLQLD